MKDELKIYEVKKKITWWQDCPPATNYIAKILNSLNLAPIQKRKMSGRRESNFKDLHGGNF